MKYNSAPIKEAIFDLRVDQLEQSSIDRLEKVYDELSDTYPNKKKQINFVGKFDLRNDTEVKNESHSEVRGFLFSTNDNTRQVQIRLDGFTFNMLNPYSEWKDFSAEALRLWEVYSGILKPKKVERIALRYINKIDIPLPLNSFQEYILNMPPIPDSLPQTFKNFFMQIDVPCNNDGTHVTLTETIGKPTPSIIPFILDIDAYKVGVINKDYSNLKIEFEKLRGLKNNTFESCISEKTRNLFR